VMRLCEDKHEEVCYEGRDCPVCAVRVEMQEQIDELVAEVKNVTDERDSLLATEQ